MKKKHYWRFPHLFDGLLNGAGSSWGIARFILVIIVIILAVSFKHMIFGNPVTWKQDLRNWVIPIATLIGVMLTGAYYIRDIFELPRWKSGWRYLRSNLFAFGYPSLVIRDGKMEVKEDETNILYTIGGPGFVSVVPGSVVLFERLKSPSNVKAAGKHFISRLERVKEAGSLKDQHGKIDQVRVTTRDGIGVFLRDVHFRYRLRAGRKWGDYNKRTMEEPYPYSVNAVFQMVYNRTVRQDGITPWHDVVQSTVRSVITEFVSKSKIDQLTAPEYWKKYAELVGQGAHTLGHEKPRKEIANQFSSRVIRKRFKDIGAELLWIDIGHFDIVDILIDEKRELTWGSRWLGEAKRKRAYAEAIDWKYKEIGRAQAQAELVKGVLEIFEGLGPEGRTRENINNIFLIRTAQLLEAMSGKDEARRESDEPILPPPTSNPSVQ